MCQHCGPRQSVMMFAEWPHWHSVSEVVVGDFTVDLQFNAFHRIKQQELNDQLRN